MNELNIRYKKDSLAKVNRELSWLAFNERVLFEALDSHVPVLDRLRFLGIYSSNLDEFFRVRVGTINRLLGEKYSDKLNYNPKEILTQIYQKIKEDEKIFNSAFLDIKKELKANGIQFISNIKISDEHLQWCRDYFKKNIRKGISPLLFRDDLKFPSLRDKSIYLAIKLELKSKKTVYSLIEVPTDFYPRFIEIPSSNPEQHYVMMLDDLIRLNLDEIYKVFDFVSAEAYTIKLTRDAELDLESDFSKSDLNLLSKTLKQRSKGQPVRFIADKSIPKDLLRFFQLKTKISKENLVLSGKYHNFKDFMNFPDFGIKQLKYKKTESLPNYKIEQEKTILTTIEKKDVLLFYPYNSFSYLLDFLRESSIDPDVVEIKMSLYRLSSKSQIVNILSNAVKNGKKVTVIMEITARFDEANNIFWANQMKDEGIKLIYGHPDYKVHSKLVYVLKKTGKKEQEYVNISTGNYNEVTADTYSDLSLFTTDSRLTKEVASVFEYLETKKERKFNHLLVAPFNLRSQLVAKINREIKHKKAGKDAHIILKLNSLVDDEIIDKLYDAKKAGVKVELIVRGICCVATELNPKYELKAISIIDKYLEHARIYYFLNNQSEECYISSADIMVRNIDYRVEVAAPIYDKLILEKIKKFLSIQLHDNVKSRTHNATMSNPRTNIPKQKIAIRSQDEIYHWLEDLNLYVQTKAITKKTTKR
jgi:polyphosphate kinase